MNTMTSLDEMFRMQDVTVRTAGTCENPLFCLKDVCDALDIVGYANKAKALDDDERVYVNCRGSRGQRMVFITEPGLYSVILTCKSAKHEGSPAWQFRRWVTHEILPEIRRRGRYVLEEQIGVLQNQNRELQADKQSLETQKGERVWVLIKTRNLWNYKTRTRYFSRVITHLKGLGYVYVDQYNAPYVHRERIGQALLEITTKMQALILADNPVDQSLITQYFQAHI